MTRTVDAAGAGVAMVRRRPPEGCLVVAGSTPVVAFGDPLAAEVATLAINPSVREFVAKGVLLAGSSRRLATLASLGAERIEELSDAQVAAVVADCAAYFDRNPYWSWFEPLDELLRAATGTTYRDRSACHLDLVQWATDPVWGKIPDATIRQRLLDDGAAHLACQLEASNVRLVLLNGATVVDQTQRAGLATLDVVGYLAETASSGNTRTWKLYAGSGHGVAFLGWSRNLQSPSLANQGFRQHLAHWVASHLQAAPDAPSEDAGAAGSIPAGATAGSKQDLVDLLRRWLARCDELTVGPASPYGGRPWVQIDLGGTRVVLNADTKRQAVEEFCAYAPTNTAAWPWPVVANRQGRYNKVTFRADGSSVPGWYCYLASPVAPGALL